MAQIRAGSRRRLSRRLVRRGGAYWVCCTRIGEASKPGPSEQTFTVVTANRSGKQPFVQFVREVVADIVLGQETMAREEEVKGYVKKMKKARPKSKVIVGPGIMGPNGGDSCGTAMVFQKALDIKPPIPDDANRAEYRMGWDAYEIVLGRITAAICNAWDNTELLIGDVYLDTRDGDGAENRHHLLQLAIKIEELGIPFII